ncbi:NADH:flavin oxidoreductase/NADH oxidase [Olivibacter sp. CPCC 100613]|uniref:NADH:flavin oxidoreductase/NADH oxidase n=1 Tax=Olivibacter sp. CPCC 100613 TaxID=3079931 RepID=UPI002FFCD96C
MSKLLSPLIIRGVTLKNRIIVSPMCQYSAINGLANDWHLVHLGSRAVGGAALVMVEATAVSAEGRISPDDLGLWNDEQVEKLLQITSFIKNQQSVPGIQLSHAGRKASTTAPWKGRGKVAVEDGGWQPVAPSAIAFADHYAVPLELEKDGVDVVIADFKSATERALRAGFELIEIHAAHGYLLHQFLSPLSNLRQDEYGGSFDNRIRLLLEVVDAIRSLVPKDFPLFVRISASDWADGGWDLKQSIQLASILKARGVDLLDVSSGGLVSYQKISVGPAYQLPFASKIKKDTGILTSTVGLITNAMQAETILVNEDADLIAMARELLRNPYFPLQAAHELGDTIEWPIQYERAKLN